MRSEGGIDPNIQLINSTLDLVKDLTRIVGKLSDLVFQMDREAFALRDRVTQLEKKSAKKNRKSKH